MPRRASGRPTRSVSRTAIRRQLLVYVQRPSIEEYIVFWHRRFRTRVRVTIADEHGSPSELVDLASAARRHADRDARRGRGAAWDEIWCVFEEATADNLGETLAAAERAGLRVTVSSPSIELWFLLHFDAQEEPLSRDEATLRARKLLGCDEILDERALEKLGERYADARARAIALSESSAASAASHGRINPSSDLWRLVDAIRNVPEVIRTTDLRTG